MSEAEIIAPAEVAPPAKPEPPVTYSPNAIHLMRTAQLNTLTLSRMADQKASILMGATFLVFSLSISRALTGHMPVSLAILAIVSFLSSLCAVLAVLPSASRRKPGDANSNKLFFGHFADLDEEEWKLSLLEELREDETVFRTMMRDIYQNGQVLQNRKYRYLGYAYKIFVGGLFMTLVVFALEWVRGTPLG